MAGRTAPGGPRRRSFAVELLSEEGKALIDELLASTSPYYSYEEIIRILKETTKEKVSRTSLSRYQTTRARG